jgi:hypothetical protein
VANVKGASRADENGLSIATRFPLNRETNANRFHIDDLVHSEGSLQTARLFYVCAFPEQMSRENQFFFVFSIQ